MFIDSYIYIYIYIVHLHWSVWRYHSNQTPWIWPSLWCHRLIPAARASWTWLLLPLLLSKMRWAIPTLLPGGPKVLPVIYFHHEDIHGVWLKRGSVNRTSPFVFTHFQIGVHSFELYRPGRSASVVETLEEVRTRCAVLQQKRTNLIQYIDNRYRFWWFWCL